MPTYLVKYAVRVKKEIIPGERLVEVEMQYKAGPKVENLVRAEFEEKDIKVINFIIEDVQRVNA